MKKHFSEPKYSIRRYSKALVAPRVFRKATIPRDFESLSREIIGCKKCPRLIAYAEHVQMNRPKRFANWNYWSKPVPGYGDLNGRVLIIGLAPASSGALRTGRIFTGDASSRFLVSALHAAGFANQSSSESVDDGLVYTDCYVTAALKCAPPGDKPAREEISNCAPYLEREISLMPNLRAVLALGSLAFKAYVGHLRSEGIVVRGLKFSQGVSYPIKGGPTLYASYHPSPRNTNTGKLTNQMLLGVLESIKRDLGRGSGARD
jgi:uracil-DNA glycosylase